MRVLLGGWALAVALVLLGAGTARADVVAHGSARQVYATGVKAGTSVTLAQGRRVLQRKAADAQGGVLFRSVKPGAGYTLSDSTSTSAPVTVFSNAAAPPDPTVYDQRLPASGYGYLTTRDGTQLALTVHPPQRLGGTLPVDLPAVTASPTLIEYSGYGYADPSGPQNGIAILANLMGFTVVDVNMRGTGCSGGAYDFFEPLQSLDGYDVIETVARQPWVANHKVGMFGISYGGISQLFTAATRPPSLAAIAPLSVLDSTQTTLYPGGVLNTGFAVNWAKERVHDALPASPTGGQAYAYDRVKGGDATCAANQALHGQAIDLLDKVRRNEHYVPKVADPLAPETFVHKIGVPTFLACQWEDEQTGGHCPTLPRAFTGTTRKWFTFTNGTHIDSLDPETFNRLYDFLSLYVAGRPPITGAAVLHAAAPVLYDQAMGVDGVTLPRDPVQEQPTYDGALQAFQALPPVRVLFDNGAGTSRPGVPQPGFEQSFPAFPAPGTTARRWAFGARGTLRAGTARGRGADAFTWDAKARPLTDFTGDTASGKDGLWTQTPPYDWKRPPAHSAVSYETAPLDADAVVLGAGAVHAWVKTKVPSVDLQATVSEIRPDGKEVFVQSGWLRADERKLDAAKSRPLEPVLSLRERDVKPLPRGRYAKVTIPLYYQGHAYRKGSRIKVAISAPNGDQPIWSFAETTPKVAVRVVVGRGRRHPSRLVLPVVPGVGVPTPLPPCPGLRGEPCR